MSYYRRAVTGREKNIRYSMQSRRKTFLETVVKSIVERGKAYFYEKRFIEEGLWGCTIPLLKKWATEEHFKVSEFDGGICVTT